MDEKAQTEMNNEENKYRKQTKPFMITKAGSPDLLRG